MFAPRHHRAITLLALIATALLTYRYFTRTTPLPPPGQSGSRANTLHLTLDPNTATLDELASIPGMGHSRAQAVISHRQSNPATPFHSLNDLESVKGFGPETIESIRPYLKFPTP